MLSHGLLVDVLQPRQIRQDLKQNRQAGSLEVELDKLSYIGPFVRLLLNVECYLSFINRHLDHELNGQLNYKHKSIDVFANITQHVLLSRPLFCTSNFVLA